MKSLIFLMVLCCTILTSCQVGATNLETAIGEEAAETKIRVLPTPKSKEIFDINSKIGIAEIRSDEPSCFRTKNGDLAKNTAVSMIISLAESPQKTLTATVEKKLEKSCARRASETGDNNPGENFFYSLKLNPVEDEEIYYDVGIAVIAPAKAIQMQDGLASVDINDDGKAEFFRVCQGFEGFYFTIWTGKPLKGKKIWDSFYYVDYDTMVTCTEND